MNIQERPRLHLLWWLVAVAAVSGCDRQGADADLGARLQALGYAGAGMGMALPRNPLPDPKSVMDLALRIERALSFGDGGDVERVAVTIEKLAVEYPDAYIVYRHLGQVYWQLEQYEKVEAAYDRCQQLRPDLPLPRWLSAKALIALGKYAEAIDAYQRALELAPKHVAILSELGRVYRYVGRIADAAETFRAISEIAPSHDLEIEELIVELGDEFEPTKEEAVRKQ